MARLSVFDMRFRNVYSALIQKAERKGRTRAEVDEVTSWLTGYSTEQISVAMDSGITYGSISLRHLPTIPVHHSSPGRFVESRLKRSKTP